MVNALDKNLQHLLYPRQTVLVASSLGDKDNVFTVDWSMPVSFNPFLVAISVGKLRHSLDVISNSGEFVLSVIGLDLEDKALCCGNFSGRYENKFEKCGLKKDRAWKVKAPLVHGAIANFECKVVGRMDAGDHVVFIGEVLEAHVDREKADGERLFNKGKRNFSGFC